MIGDAEKLAVENVLSGTTLVHGRVTKEFEEKFAERCGTSYAISMSSCTAALHLSLFAQGIGHRDKVAVPAMTHVATAHAAEYCGAEPVFIDVDPATGNISPDLIKEASEKNELSAIIVVHYLGLPCDMDAIVESLKNSAAFIVEDSALALDASYGDQKAGSLGSSGCFSFYPIKHITSLEGGMLTTNNGDLAAKISQSKAFGYDRSLGQRSKPGIYDVNRLGFNFRMNEVEAAVGLAQMDKLDEFQARRAENYQIIKKELTEIDELTVFEPVVGKAKSSHYCLNAVLPRDGSIERDILVAELKNNGVGSSVHYPSAVPLFAFYREKYGYRSGQFPVAEWLAEQTVSLPVGPHVSSEDAEYIGQIFKKSIHKARAK